MKHLLFTSAIALFTLLTSCSKNTYNEDYTELGQVIEITTSFDASNDYYINYSLNSLSVFESDAVLVYLLEDVVNGNEDVWTPLPQTFYVSGGQFQYSYNHTYYDVAIFMQGNIDLSTLSSIYTQNQVFRIVVVPAAYAQNNPTDYASVTAHFGLNEADVVTLP